ncbi:hypothetical protein AAF712_005862 [Marasmius tenuissimus]|uniref:SH3 domain-containing protein n=1 Tax=Marasmius tenuissimus TaxID=585030 RepID=A0ABR3A0H3_9AGAR
MPRRIQFRRRTSKYSAGRNSLLRRQQERRRDTWPYSTHHPPNPSNGIGDAGTFHCNRGRHTDRGYVYTDQGYVHTGHTPTVDNVEKVFHLCNGSRLQHADYYNQSRPAHLYNHLIDQPDPITSLEGSSTPSILPPTSTPTGDVPAAAESGSFTDVAPSNSNVQNKGLSTGAIVGIAVVGLVVLVVLIAFLIRRTIAAKRAKRRDDWFEKSLFSSPQAPPSIVSSDASSISASVFPPPPTTFGIASGAPPSYAYAMPPPPSRQPSIASLARPGTPPSLIPGRRGGDLAEPPAPFQAQASAVPIGVPTAPPTMAAFYPPPIAPAPQPPQTALNPQRSATVRSSFVPTREDELLILGGEVVYVLQEYDDGWGLCLNQAGKQGAVPLECLNDGTREDKPALTRGSSLSRK